MIEIFEKAACVVAWLSVATDEDKTLFSYMSKVQLGQNSGYPHPNLTFSKTVPCS
jgi:hypothetical protein